MKPTVLPPEKAGQPAGPKPSLGRAVQMNTAEPPVQPTGNASLGWQAERSGAEVPWGLLKSADVPERLRAGDLSFYQEAFDPPSLLPSASARVEQVLRSAQAGFRPEATSASVDWQPVVEQITRHVPMALPENRGEMQLRLEPPQLGRLRLWVTVEDGRVTARIVTETKEAHSLLKDHVSELRTALGENGLRVQEVKLTLAGGSDSFVADSGAFGQERQGLPQQSSRQAGSPDGDAFSSSQDRPSSQNQRRPAPEHWGAPLGAGGQRIDYRV